MTTYPPDDEVKSIIRQLFHDIGPDKLNMKMLREHLQAKYDDIDFKPYSETLSTLVNQVMSEPAMANVIVEALGPHGTREVCEIAAKHQRAAAAAAAAQARERREKDEQFQREQCMKTLMALRDAVCRARELQQQRRRERTSLVNK